MNRRDRELLDKQLWGVSPRSPRAGSARVVALAVVFLVGLAAGDALFSPQHEGARTASIEGPISALIVDAGPSLSRR